jgi:hypothetical protein
MIIYLLFAFSHEMIASHRKKKKKRKKKTTNGIALRAFFAVISIH